MRDDFQLVRNDDIHYIYSLLFQVVQWIVYYRYGMGVLRSSIV